MTISDQEFPIFPGMMKSVGVGVTKSKRGDRFLDICHSMEPSISPSINFTSEDIFLYSFVPDYMVNCSCLFLITLNKHDSDSPPFYEDLFVTSVHDTPSNLLYIHISMASSIYVFHILFVKSSTFTTITENGSYIQVSTSSIHF